MTLTLDAPARVGPGLAVSVFSDVVGAIPNDDRVQLIIQDATTAANFMFGDVLARGAHSWLVTLGKSEVVPQPVGLNWGNGVDGYGVNLIAFQYHANGTLVDGSGIVPGWAWDATSGLFTLFQSTGDLATVLAAVTRTWV